MTGYTHGHSKDSPMDAKKIAADAKAKALADLKAAEQMMLAAEQIESVARQFGWKVVIDANVIAASPAPAVEAPAAQPLPPFPKAHEIIQKKTRGGKQPDPNSITSRSKSEGVKIVRELMRPVPLGELLKRLEERDVKLGGKNPNQALSANLGNCPELRSTPRGWWLMGVPLPRENKSKTVGGGEQLPGLN
jgi:hypothetical protein